MTKCPQCGYSEVNITKAQSNVMNRYVNKSKPTEVIMFNGDEKEVTIGKDEKSMVTYIRKDVWDKLNDDKPKVSAEIKSANPTTTAPTTPVK